MTIKNIKTQFNTSAVFRVFSSCMHMPTWDKFILKAAEYMSNDAVSILGYYSDNQIAGVIVVAEQANGVFEIKGIAVDCKYRRQGIGKVLIKYVYENFPVSLLTAETDDDAVYFYTQCGFKAEKFTRISENGEYVRYKCVKQIKMQITDRDITKKELDDIYADFTKIEIQDGVPQAPQVRHQFVAEENGVIVGFASGLTNHKWFYLTDLWIHEDYRRQGLGAKLLGMLEDKIKSIGIKHIYTWTTGFINPNFYENQGYYIFTIFENFCEVEGYHKIGYRKDLV